MRDDEPTRSLGPLAALESGETLPADEPSMGGTSSPALRVGTRVGRYLLEDELGRGGMGVVYAAHDPELDRRVAIKLLRSRAADGTEGKARLQREAQALAKLAHPNVVSVFDVGTVGADVFIAMELTTGGNLRAYQRDRAWADIVRAYVQAGRGLAAAHAADLVHRDFKPDNVLVGGDGRMRVTDFGLVRVADRPELVAAATPVRASASGAMSSSLTEAGSVMGTPLYMAPEQMSAGEIGPAADQFAFAVALWQALHGETPFTAFELPARRQEIVDGARRPPRNRGVPARIQRALERALAAEPAQRWPTMAALLDELERGLRRPRPYVAVAAAAVVAAAVVVALVVGRGAAPSPCAQADASGAGLWSGARARVADAFGISGAPYADASFKVVDARLTKLERDWRAASVEACRDTRVRHAQPEGVYAQRAACLAVRRQQTAAFIETLVGVDRDRIADVPALITTLPRLEECADPQILAGLVPRPTQPEAAAGLVELETRLATLAGRADDADDATYDAVVAAARQLGYPPIEAEALIVRAGHAIGVGRFDPARADLVDAAAAATRGGDRGHLATAYLELLALDADERGDLDGAASWGELGAAAVDALGRPLGKRLDLALGLADLARAQGQPARAAAALAPILEERDLDPMARFQVDGLLALVLSDQGEYDQAEAVFARLEPAVVAALGAEHPYALTIATNRAMLLYQRGELAQCRAALTPILATRERVLGPAHVQIAQSLEALAACENKSGHSRAALTKLERAVAIYRAARGPEHPRTLSAMSDLGGAYSHLNQHAEALALNQELLAIRERTLGPDHLDVATSLVNTAIEAKNTGAVALAIGYDERALAIFEQALGPEHPNVAVALINYGEALRAGGRAADAIAAFTRAGTIITAALGPAHPLLAHVEYGRGMAELARGRARDAVAWLERAVARRAGPDQDPNEQAEAELGLAQALVAAGGDRRRARALAEHAIATWTAAGDEFADKRAAATAWLPRAR